MPVSRIDSFLVLPGRDNENTPPTTGTEVPPGGRTHDMLTRVYEKSDTECNIDISFNHDAQGGQNNTVRNLLVAYIGAPSLDNGRLIANRLQSVTTHRSGIGLLFLLTGTEGRKQKLVVSRFPADTGISAEARGGRLMLEFLEKVFMKKATAYKAAVYADRSVVGGFWAGKCIDKQLSSRWSSAYWIMEFLDSDFRTTPALGTRRLAEALRGVMARTDSQAVKEEVVAAARLVDGLGNDPVSPRSFAQRMAFSPETTAVFQAQFQTADLFTQQFRLDRDEFRRHIAFASIVLDNGGILTAESSRFNHIFERREAEDGVTFSTHGRVVDHKLRKGQP